MNYDQWKLRSDLDESDLDDYETDSFPRVDDEREGCVLGNECCCPHPFHGAAECFDVAMAEAWFLGDIGGEA